MIILGQNRKPKLSFSDVICQWPNIRCIPGIFNSPQCTNSFCELKPVTLYTELTDLNEHWLCDWLSCAHALIVSLARLLVYLIDWLHVEKLQVNWPVGINKVLSVWIWTQQVLLFWSEKARTWYEITVNIQRYTNCQTNMIYGQLNDQHLPLLTGDPNRVDSLSSLSLSLKDL